MLDYLVGLTVRKKPNVNIVSQRLSSVHTNRKVGKAVAQQAFVFEYGPVTFEWKHSRNREFVWIS